MPFSPACYNMLSDLKAAPVSAGAVVILAGKNATGDGLGGFFYWDAASVLAEELTNMTVIKATAWETGRWRRNFQRVFTYPGGTLVTNGERKTFYATAMTDINGRATINMTDDGTSNGNALFTTIDIDHSKANQVATSPMDATTSYRYALPASLKTLTHGYYKPNVLTLTLGLLYNPFASVGANIPVSFQIEGK